MSAYPANELIEILKIYDLGELVDFQRDERGYVNTSFFIRTRQFGRIHKYFFRRYKKGIREEELQYEHSIIQHLIKHGFNLVANLLKTKKGDTYIAVSSTNLKSDAIYYAIFEFLYGEDRYTWIAPKCTLSEINNAAVVLAEFHSKINGFTPLGERYEPKIKDMKDLLINNLYQCTRLRKNDEIEQFWLENTPVVVDEIERVYKLLDVHYYAQLIQLVNHCDYHPGNLKFENEHVVGLFDFDWSKVDVRIFDVALALFYFFTCWEGEFNGELRLDDVALFLNTYQDSLVSSNKLSVISKIETKILPALLSASNLYVLNWAIIDYINKDVNHKEYLEYFTHGVKAVLWYQNKDNGHKLTEQIHSVCSPYW